MVILCIVNGASITQTILTIAALLGRIAIDWLQSISLISLVIHPKMCNIIFIHFWNKLGCCGMSWVVNFLDLFRFDFPLYVMNFLTYV